jgi:hypothetical protein
VYEILPICIIVFCDFTKTSAFVQIYALTFEKIL